MFKDIVSKRSKLYAGFAGVAALALFTACGSEEPAPEEEPVDPGVEQQDPTQAPLQESPMQESPMQEEPNQEDPLQEEPMQEDTGEVEGAGEDRATSTLGFVGTTVSWAL